LHTISNISENFNNGKSFRELLEEAEEDERIRKPGHFSDTRFATHSSVVIDKFFNNYKQYYGILKRKKTVREEELFNKMSEIEFFYTCAGLADIYSEIAIMSKEFQNPHTTPWLQKHAVEDGIYELNEKLHVTHGDPADLEVFDYQKFKLNYPKLSEVYEGVRDYGEFKESPIYNNVHDIEEDENPEEPLKQALRNCGEFTERFINNFQDRMNIEDAKTRAIVLVNDLFDVSKIVHLDGVEDVAPALKVHVRLIFSFNNFEKFKLDGKRRRNPNCPRPFCNLSRCSVYYN